MDAAVEKINANLELFLGISDVEIGTATKSILFCFSVNSLLRFFFM
jgi:hypothetical protein